MNGFLLVAFRDGPAPISFPLSLHATIDEAIRAAGGMHHAPGFLAAFSGLDSSQRADEFGTPADELFVPNLVEYSDGQPVRRYVVRKVDGEHIAFRLDP
jgi:hypothetical protein